MYCTYIHMLYSTLVIQQLIWQGLLDSLSLPEEEHNGVDGGDLEDAGQRVVQEVALDA